MRAAMAAPSFSFSFIVLALAFLHFAFTLNVATAQEQVEFGYEGELGPDNWANLSPDFQTCANGRSQSPVNIKNNVAVLNSTLNSLTTSYRSGQATLVKNGFNIEARFDGDVGGVSIDGKSYDLRQMHWHTPSEHSIDGIGLAAEQHLVHRAGDGSTTVVSILFQIGNPDPLLSQLRNGIDEVGNGASQASLGTIDSQLIDSKVSGKYYRYVGSLTTPPCTEPVIWNVFGDLRTISQDQVDALKAPLNFDSKNNVRPQQNLNGRSIQFFNN